MPNSKPAFASGALPPILVASRLPPSLHAPALRVKGSQPIKEEGESMSDIKDLQRQIAKLNESIGRLAGDQEAIQFETYAKACLEAKLLNPTLRASTKRSFQNQVTNHLVPAFGSLELGKITNPVFLKWVIEKRKSQPGFRFFNARKSLIEILNSAKSDGHLEKLPKLDNPDEPRNVGRVLEDAEVLKILKNTRQRIFRFFFYCLWKMGCRPREILQWEYSMIKWETADRAWISIPARISKTKRSREIPLHAGVAKRIYKEHMSNRSAVFVFPKIGDPTKPQMEYHAAWRTATKRAGVKAMPYDTRRTFASRCAAEGKSLMYIAKFLDTSTKMLEGVYVKTQKAVLEDLIK